MVVILITGIFAQIQYLTYKDMKLESLFINEYKNSEDFFNNDVSTAISHMTNQIENGREMPKDIVFNYYITNGKEIKLNADISYIEQYDNAFYAYENGNWRVGENTSERIKSSFYIGEDYTIYLSFSDEYLKGMQSKWQESKALVQPYVIGIISSLVLALILIIYLISVAGRKTEDNELHLSKIDGIYSDVLFLALIPIGIIWFLIGSEYYIYRGHLSTGLNLNGYQIFAMIIMGATTAITSILCGIILLSLSRKIKAGKFFRQSIIYKVVHNINDFFKSFFDGRRFEKFPLTKSLHLRQIAFIIASAILVFFTFLFIMAPPLMIIPPILELVIIYWYVKYNNTTFEEINKGFNESLEEQMKSERMKINLVTNVSHDIKTPLTSIISYVDLLSKEEDLSETAKDYIDILTEKSNRLKNIVADLFDLAKSTSGDINLDFETLDLKKLIEQTLGDMEDDIAKSGLQIKTKLPENPVNIFSDGKKLYRVFQNVIDNALKYSLKGTRVFVELEEDNGRALATIKNTAGYEMDFSADEILQRFSRGDQSRTTEGSGLGLSIAESFINVCGGDLKLDIDGDMFKVIISFNLV